MTRLRLMASAIAATFLAVPIGAEEINITYADERCRDSEAAGVWCMSMAEPATIGDFVEDSRFSLEQFINENALPEGTTSEAEVPAFRFFVMGYRVLSGTD